MFMIIKIILINLLFISLPILSSNASITSNNQELSHLIAALTKIDKPKSLKVAKELTSSNNSYDLIIRRANLNILDAGEISNAIKKISHQKVPVLKTISMSFNKDLKPHMSMKDTLHLICSANELENVRVRDEELKELDTMKNKAPYPVKGGVENPNGKCNVLLQAHISRFYPRAFTLVSDGH